MAVTILEIHSGARDRKGIHLFSCAESAYREACREILDHPSVFYEEGNEDAMYEFSVKLNAGEYQEAFEICANILGRLMDGWMDIYDLPADQGIDQPLTIPPAFRI